MVGNVVNINSDINPTMQRVFKSNARHLLVYGGAGAGKSYAVAQKLIIKALYYGDRRIIATRKTMPALKATSIELVKYLLEKYNVPYKENKSAPYTIRVGGSVFYFLPMVNTKGGGEAAARIKSMTRITDIWAEEATELTQAEDTQLALRLRGEPLKRGTRQFIRTFNPIDANHWIKHKFFDMNIGERLRYTYKDNRFIDSEYIKELEALKVDNPTLYDIYALGHWGTPQDLIYTNWVVRNIDYPPDWYDVVINGEDFGYNNPSAHIMIGIKDQDIYIYDEIYQSHLLNSQFIDLIKQKNAEWGLPPQTPHYADTAEPDRITEFEQAGLLVYPAIKSVIPGINKVKSLRVYVDPRCVNVIKERNAYSYRKDRWGRVLDEPVKIFDHAMDAIRYAVYTYYTEGNKKVEQF